MSRVAELDAVDGHVTQFGLYQFLWRLLHSFHHLVYLHFLHFHLHTHHPQHPQDVMSKLHPYSYSYHRNETQDRFVVYTRVLTAALFDALF